jgi:hypothetical protein
LETNNDNTSRILTQIAAVLRIAYARAIDEEREELFEDKANRALFKATASWATTAALQKAIVGGKAASRSTFFRRLDEFVDRGLLERRKVGNVTEYRSSGLI